MVAWRALCLCGGLALAAGSAPRPPGRPGEDQGALIQIETQIDPAGIWLDRQERGLEPLIRVMHAMENFTKVANMTEMVELLGSLGLPTALPGMPIKVGDVPDASGILRDLKGLPSEESIIKSLPTPGEMLKYVLRLFEAVKTSEFMESMTKLTAAVRNATSDFVARGRGKCADLASKIDPEEDEDALATAVQYLGIAREMLLGFADRLNSTLWLTIQEQPEDMQEMVKKAGKAMLSLSWNDILMEVPANVSRDGLCLASKHVTTMLNELTDVLRWARSLASQSDAILPLMRGTITSMKPDAAPRIMYLAKEAFNTTSVCLERGQELAQDVLDKVVMVTKRKLRCGQPWGKRSALPAARSVAGPRLGTALAAVLVALAAPLLA